MRPRSRKMDHVDNVASSDADESSDGKIKCRRCGGEDFKGKKKGGRHVLICGRCGVVAQ